MTGLYLGGIHARYEGVLKIMKQRKCSLAKAMEKYGVARNTLRGFIGICELKILDRNKFNTVVSTERGRCGKPSVKDIELRCRTALSEYRAQSKRFKEEGRLLSSFLQKAFTQENNKQTL